MTDRIGASTVNGAARRLMAAVARFVGEAQPTGDVPDLRAEVRALERRIVMLEARQASAPSLCNSAEGGRPVTFGAYTPDVALPGVHTHKVLDFYGQPLCGMPGCCAIRCRHS